MDKRLFVFLRHNNDIDHITPVVWKWLKTTSIPVELIITTDRKFLDDYRINLLKSMGDINIRFITEQFNLYIYLYKKYYTSMDRYTMGYGFIKKRVDRIIKKIADSIFKDTEEGVVCFDWVNNYFTRCMLHHAKQHGYKTVSLPHGDSPYINQLETLDDIDFDKVIGRYDQLDMFDNVVVPNWIVKRRYKNLGNVKMFGSSRYSDEWMKFYDEHIQCYRNKHNGLRVVMFLRNLGYPIFWDEVGRAIKMVMSIPDVYLIVKQHARSSRNDVICNRLFYKYPELKKHSHLSFVYGDSNPSSLIRWCDLVVDLGTSMTWECVKKNVPVLCLDYVHSNKSTLGYYMENCLMDCRDKFFNTLGFLVEKGVDGFYNMDARGTFLREVVDGSDKDVLGRYVGFLEGLF